MPLSEFPRVPGKHNDPKQLGYWKLGRILGEGSSGRVRIARHAKTGQMAAIKIIPKNLLTSHAEGLNLAGKEAERKEQSLCREVVLMKLIEHPNIMGLYDVWDLPDELFLVLEYVQGGELLDILSRAMQSEQKTVPISQVLSFFQQIVIAVSYCHRLNVSHRDLKLENILVDNENNIKVADFGLASFQPNSPIVRTACGSLHYCAPEVVTGYGNYNGFMADVWSCGIILYALLTCSLPFSAELEEDLRDEIIHKDVRFPDSVPPEAQDLISKMLTKDAHKRITMSEVKNHPFFLLQKPKIVYRGISSLEQIAMPLKSVEDIDLELLRSLRTLSREASDEELKDSLTSPDMNWQKGAYHLLFEYRRKRLEAYDEQVAEIEEKRMQREARARARAARHAAAKASKEAELSRVDPSTPRRAVRRGRNHPDMHMQPSPSSIPSREGPPTPRRAARGGRTLGPASAASSDTSFIPMERPSHLVPSKFSEDEIRPSLDDDDDDGAVSSSRKSFKPPPAVAGAKTEIPSALPPITIPESDDPNVRAFYNQVLEHLSVLHSRIPGSGGASTVVELGGVVSPNLALMQEIFKDRTMVGSTPFAPMNLSGVDSRLKSQPNDSTIATARIQTRPLSLKRKEGMATGITTPTPKQHQQQRPKRPTIITTAFDSTDKENGQLNLTPAPKRTSIVKKSSLRKALGLGKGDNHTPKRVQILDPAPPTPALAQVAVLVQVPQSQNTQKPSKLKKKRSLRGNANTNTSHPHSHTPSRPQTSRSSSNPSPAPSSTSSFLSSSSPFSLTPVSVSLPLSPMSTGGSGSGWFANVFKFNKPEVFTLRSMHAVHTTRNECRRLLMAMDVRVVLEEDHGRRSEGLGVLKCKLDEIKDRATGNGSGLLKATKFKIIVRQSLESERDDDGVSLILLVLVHEKGSADSFREICRRLRREWTLDEVESQTPEQLVPSPMPALATRRMELLSPV